VLEKVQEGKASLQTRLKQPFRNSMRLKKSKFQIIPVIRKFKKIHLQLKNQVSSQGLKIYSRYQKPKGQLVTRSPEIIISN